MSEKKSPIKVPERPWKKGKQDEYTCFNITVRVAETQGNVFSDHELEDEGDRTHVLKMTSGGLAQAAYALLTEALRSEVRYLSLVKLQGSPDYILDYLKADSPTKLSIESTMANAIAKSFQDNMQINMIAIVRECFESLAMSSGATPKQ